MILSCPIWLITHQQIALLWILLSAWSINSCSVLIFCFSMHNSHVVNILLIYFLVTYCNGMKFQLGNIKALLSFAHYFSSPKLHNSSKRDPFARIGKVSWMSSLCQGKSSLCDNTATYLLNLPDYFYYIIVNIFACIWLPWSILEWHESSKAELTCWWHVRILLTRPWCYVIIIFLLVRAVGASDGIENRYEECPASIMCGSNAAIFLHVSFSALLGRRYLVHSWRYMHVNLRHI